MRPDKSQRHWRYWCRLHHLSHAAFARHMAVWERFFGVWPRGYMIGETEGLSFEKIHKAR